jgi:D-alanyl-D-alanine carboxypeptidase/D-alanyl-D-alanine-endopeptidase (penicillin-binding protein 4)
MLATSDNLTAEMMVKEVGLHVAGKGTRTDGLQAITKKLADWGISTDGLAMVDGSGLSRGNRVTCSTMLAVLQRGTATDLVGAGMALAGQSGSTLDGRFQEAGLAGVLQGKTGTLNGVKALCGYFPAAGGEVQFVLILNGDTATTFATPWSQLGTALLAATAAPTPERLAPVGATDTQP